MSFHPGQTFTFGEQPSASKWQFLWDNDYALADGSGITDNAIAVGKNTVATRPRVKISLTPLTQATQQISSGASTTIITGSISVPTNLSAMALEVLFSAKNVFGSTNNDTFDVSLQLDGTEIGSGRYFAVNTSGRDRGMIIYGAKTSITSGSHTLAAVAVRSSGSGTMTFEAASTAPITLVPTLY